MLTIVCLCTVYASSDAFPSKQVCQWIMCSYPRVKDKRFTDKFTTNRKKENHLISGKNIIIFYRQEDNTAF